MRKRDWQQKSFGENKSNVPDSNKKKIHAEFFLA
jgi:hypothetical protein